MVVAHAVSGVQSELEEELNLLGLHFNSVTMNVCLTPQRIDSLERALSHFQLGRLVTARRVQKHYRVLLVAPCWTGRTWFPDLIQLIQDHPWQLPSRADLLSQVDRFSLRFGPHTQLPCACGFGLCGVRLLTVG